MEAAELTSLLSRVLTRRASGDQPTILNLVGDATLFRPRASLQAAGGRISLESLLGRRTPWMPVGRFTRMLEPLLGDSAAMRGGNAWGGAVLPFLTASACRWAAILARQMGAEPSCRVTPGCAGSLRADYLACLNDATEALQVTGQILDAIVHVFQVSANGRAKAEAPAMLRIEPDQPCVRVIWLARDGSELRRETLEGLAAKMSSDPEVAELCRKAEELEDRQAKHRDSGDRVLEATCPALVEAVRQAREHNRCVGYRVCAKRMHGLPAEVILYVGPGPDALRYACASIVARRAHEEFVLENPGGQLFYFPPAQLQAMIEFAPSDPPWRVPLPTVRMPPRQPSWVHPYTGALHADRFADAVMLSGDANEPMAPVSDDARRLVPGLGEFLPNGPATGGMCLGGQDSQTAALAKQVRDDETAEKEPYLLGLVAGLWEVVRVGLTRGHQNNDGTPLAELSPLQMPFPIASRAAVKGTKLAARLYPYNRYGRTA